MSYELTTPYRADIKIDVRLRQFLYRDDSLVREFLGQIEGGLFEEDTQISRSGAQAGIGGELGAGPARVTGKRGREHSQEQQRVVRQTGASEFERFYSALDEQGAIQVLDAIDETIWDQIQRGEIAEIEAIIQPTGLQKIRELFGVFEELLPIAQAAGVEESLEPEAQRVLTFIQQLADANPADTVPMIASLASTTEFKFVASLRAENLEVPPGLLEGEATVCGKIQRKLQKGETYMVGAVFAGLEAVLDDKSRAEIDEIFEKPELRSLGIASPKVQHPAAVLTPIYR